MSSILPENKCTLLVNIGYRQEKHATHLYSEQKKVTALRNLLSKIICQEYILTQYSTPLTAQNHFYDTEVILLKMQLAEEELDIQKLI